jgi:hypothetical protein
MSKGIYVVLHALLIGRDDIYMQSVVYHDTVHRNVKGLRAYIVIVHL